MSATPRCAFRILIPALFVVSLFGQTAELALSTSVDPQGVEHIIAKVS